MAAYPTITACITSAAVEMKSVKGLLEELEKLKADNAQLSEWISWGKYSVR